MTRRTQRPLALFERAMYLDGDAPVNIMVTASLHGRLAEERLRGALARVQAKHTLLRCLIARRDGRPWFVLQRPAPPIPLRIVERRHDDDWMEASTAESLTPFDGSRQPLARLVWFRGAEQSELLLVCHHALCDGRSLLTLLREILLLCDRSEASIGDDTALDTIEEMLPAAVRADRGLERRVRFQAAGLKLLLRGTRLLRPRSAWTYGPPYHDYWTLDEPAARELMERCKTEDVSAFAAMSVAFMSAFRAVCGRRGIEKFVAPVDARRFLPDLRADSLFAIAPTVSLSVGESRAGTPADSEFWELARRLKRDVDGKIARLGPTVYSRFLGLERLHDVYDTMTAYGRSRRAGRRVSLSYLGRLELEQDYRDFRLLAVRGVSAMLAPTPAHLIVISSFAGRFDFSLASDETSLPRAQAMRIREAAMTTLRTHVSRAEPRGRAVVGESR